MSLVSCLKVEVVEKEQLTISILQMDVDSDESVDAATSAIRAHRSCGIPSVRTLASGPVQSGRCRRSVLVCDTGRPRNAAAHALLYGASVFHCPYCDGWEHRDQPIAIYGRGARGLELSLELTAWSRDLVLCTDGPAEIDENDRARLSRNSIDIREETIARLEGTGGVLEHVVLESDERLPRRALFFTTGQFQRSDLSIQLGCEFNDKGTVRTGKYEYAALVRHVIENEMLNGEVIRLDGALRMAPR